MKAPGSAAEGPTLLGSLRVLLPVLRGRSEVFRWLLAAGTDLQSEGEGARPGRVGQAVSVPTPGMPPI